MMTFSQFSEATLTKNQRRTGFGEPGYRGFGNKYYTEYGFIDSRNGKVIKGAGNGDHEMLALTALQIKKSKRSDPSQTAIDNGYIRYIITPKHQGVFQALNIASTRKHIAEFLYDRPSLTSCIIHFHKPNSNSDTDDWGRSFELHDLSDLDDLISGNLTRYAR